MKGGQGEAARFCDNAQEVGACKAQIIALMTKAAALSKHSSSRLRELLKLQRDTAIKQNIGARNLEIHLASLNHLKCQNPLADDRNKDVSGHIPAHSVESAKVHRDLTFNRYT